MLRTDLVDENSLFLAGKHSSRGLDGLTAREVTRTTTGIPGPAEVLQLLEAEYRAIIAQYEAQQGSAGS